MRDVAPTYKEKTTLYLSNKAGVITELPNSKNKKNKAFYENEKQLNYMSRRIN